MGHDISEASLGFQLHVESMQLTGGEHAIDEHVVMCSLVRRPGPPAQTGGTLLFVVVGPGCLAPGFYPLGGEGFNYLICGSPRDGTHDDSKGTDFETK